MDLTLYAQMTADQRAELDGRTKRSIIEAMLGRWVPSWFLDTPGDPMATANRMMAVEASDTPLPVAEAGQRGGLVR